MLELIYSIDDSSYQAWQAGLLDWSARQTGMDCRISRLTALAPDRDAYRCLNRFWSIVHQWKPSDAETVVVLDPDMVFVRPLNVVARPKVIMGQPYGYVHDLPWCPLVLHRDQVHPWASTGLSLARAIYANGGGWISEMWAGTISAHAIGLQLDRCRLSAFNCESTLNGAAIIHYCYDHAGFFKQRYQPGERLVIQGTSEVQHHLLSLINHCFCPASSSPVVS